MRCLNVLEAATVTHCASLGEGVGEEDEGAMPLDRKKELYDTMLEVQGLH